MWEYSLAEDYKPLYKVQQQGTNCYWASQSRQLTTVARSGKHQITLTLSMMGVAGCLDQNKVEYNWMLRFGRLYSNWRITFAESVPRTIEASINNFGQGTADSSERRAFYPSVTQQAEEQNLKF